MRVTEGLGQGAHSEPSGSAGPVALLLVGSQARTPEQLGPGQPGRASGVDEVPDGDREGVDLGPSAIDGGDVRREPAGLVLLVGHEERRGEHDDLVGIAHGHGPRARVVVRLVVDPGDDAEAEQQVRHVPGELLGCRGEADLRRADAGLSDPAIGGPQASDEGGELVVGQREDRLGHPLVHGEVPQPVRLDQPRGHGGAVGSPGERIAGPVHGGGRGRPDGSSIEVCADGGDRHPGGRGEFIERRPVGDDPDLVRACGVRAGPDDADLVPEGAGAPGEVLEGFLPGVGERDVGTCARRGRPVAEQVGEEADLLLLHAGRVRRLRQPGRDGHGVHGEVEVAHLHPSAERAHPVVGG